MKTKLFGILLLAGSSLFARSQFGISVGYGPGYGYGGYYAPAPVVVYAPPPPPRYYAPPRYVRPGYTWIGGYWQPAGPRWVWRGGYWGRRPHPRAYWVQPRYYGNRWRAGYWR
jgi:hypothetical protein